MSVEVTYLGRFGNQVFIYVCGRLFAIENGLHFKTPIFPNNIFTVTAHEPGEDRSSEPEIELRDDTVGVELFSKKFPPAHYRLYGYWQWGRWYHERRQKILSFIKPPQIGQKNTKDIVMHVRLSDYKTYKWAIHQAWYLSILKNEKFGQLYIVTDEFDREYLLPFKQYDPLILCSDPIQDWNFIREFDRIITSQSTFSWWAAFFSEASKVYTFKRYQFGVDLNYFPNGIVVDGPLLHEA